MDLIDLIVTIVECVAIGLGMELGAVLAKILSVRILNDASPVTVHDVEDEEDEESAKRRRRRATRGSGGPSTSSVVRAM